MLLYHVIFHAPYWVPSQDFDVVYIQQPMLNAVTIMSC